MSEIMSALLLASLGMPVNCVKFRLKNRRKNFHEVSPVLASYGAAATTALIMEERDWYLTDQNYLVCGTPADVGLPTLTLELCFEDGNNLQWLEKRSQKSIWDNFYTPVEIKHTPLARLCFLLERDLKF